jgi:hypothetical protein
MTLPKLPPILTKSVKLGINRAMPVITHMTSILHTTDLSFYSPGDPELKNACCSIISKGHKINIGNETRQLKQAHPMMNVFNGVIAKVRGKIALL